MADPVTVTSPGPLCGAHHTLLAVRSRRLLDEPLCFSKARRRLGHVARLTGKPFPRSSPTKVDDLQLICVSRTAALGVAPFSWAEKAASGGRIAGFHPPALTNVERRQLLARAGLISRATRLWGSEAIRIRVILSTLRLAFAHALSPRAIRGLSTPTPTDSGSCCSSFSMFRDKFDGAYEISPGLLHQIRRHVVA
jgi:hypothetical protein